MIDKIELLQFIERIEKLEFEKKSLNADIVEVYKQATDAGFDKKAIKYIINLKNKDIDEIAEEDALFKAYREVLGI